MKNLWTIFSMFGLAIIGISGFILFKKTLIIEAGSIAFFSGLIWELYGTKKGLWKNSPSPIFTIANRLPIEIALSYFFLGMIAASYVTFRLMI